MGLKRETILYVAQDAGEANKVIVWTNSFRAEGTLFKDKENFERNVITLMDAHICNPFEKCTCEGRSTIKWLNIFEDEVISFSVVQD